MRVPHVSERVKEAPAQALRGMFAGIGQLLLVTDKLKNKRQAAEPPQPEADAAEEAPVSAEAAAPAADAPASEAPASEAPVAKAPAKPRATKAPAKAQAAKAPAAEAPVAEAEAPATETPAAETLAAEAPVKARAAKAPAKPRAPRATAKTAKAEVPVVEEAPAAVTAEAPAPEAPAAKAPAAETPAAEAPAAEAPKAAAAKAPAAKAARDPNKSGNVRVLSAEDAETTSPEASSLPLPNYDGLSVASLRARLRTLTSAQVAELVGYEKVHADRPEVVAMFERRIAKIEAED
jgi:hypothetical protein